MAVSISSITGTLTHGSTLTINGSGFGSHADYGGTETFLCAAWNDFLTSLDDGNWERDNVANENLSLQTTGARGGASTQFYRKIYAGSSRQGGVTHINTGDPRVFYTSFWYKESDTGLGTHGAATKYYRHYFGDPNRDFYFGPNWESTTEAGYGTHNGRYAGSAAGDVFNPAETWRFMEVITYLTGGTSNYGSDDYMEHRLNNTRLVRRGSGLASNHIAAEGSDANENDQWVGFDQGAGQANNHSIDLGDLMHDAELAGAHMDFSDAYLSHTIARVMLGTASTFAACTSFEMQIPLTWSSTQITIQANRGAQSSLTNKYIYVVDSTNSVNSNGFQLTSGGGGGGGNVVFRR